MSSFTNTVLEEHVRLIDERIDVFKENLTNRGAVPDYETYLQFQGKIEGLRMARELCEEAVKRVNKR